MVKVIVWADMLPTNGYMDLEVNEDKDPAHEHLL